MESVRTALAMGADQAVLIGPETLEKCGRLKVAKAIAAAIREITPDIVLCGYRAVDIDMAQRGPMVAGLLGGPTCQWPSLSNRMAGPYP